MGNKSSVVPKEPIVKEATRRAYSDLKALPLKKRRVDFIEQPEEDVRPLPEFYIDLSFPNEDMSSLRAKYRVLSSSLPAKETHFELLGFSGGTMTQMFTRDKKVKLSRKSPHALGRSLFKKGFTHKDQCTSMEVNKEDKSQKNDDDDRLDSKKKLREFVARAKARARIAREKGKKVQSTSVTHREKKKGPKIRSIKDIEEATKDQCVFI